MGSGADCHDARRVTPGGLLSNAADLFRWSRAVLTAQLFSAALVEASVTPFRDDYGYGWQARRFFGRTIYNHTGAIDGFSSHLAHYPDDELTIVVLTNVENDPAILWACDVAARLFGRAPAEVAASGLTAQQRRGGVRGKIMEPIHPSAASCSRCAPSQSTLSASTSRPAGPSMTVRWMGGLFPGRAENLTIGYRNPAQWRF